MTIADLFGTALVVVGRRSDALARDEEPHFNRGIRLAERVLLRLRFPRDECGDLVAVVAHQQRDCRRMSPA
jgi:hypothetical protein